MYKFLLLSVFLPLVVSNVMGRAVMDYPFRPHHIDPEGSDMIDDYNDDYGDMVQRKIFNYDLGMPELHEIQMEDEPEDKPEYEPANEPEDKLAYDPGYEPEDKLTDEPVYEPEEISQDETEDKSEGEPEDKPEDKSEDEPENKPEDKSDDEPETKPETQSEDNLKNLENRLDNIVEKLDDLIKVTTENKPTEVTGSTTNIIKELSSEYLVTKGIGAHKLHLRRLSWNKARKVCIDEGGQLADIRSDSEEKILLRMLNEEDVEFAWVGYHDIFEEGDWVSVLGEPLGKSGWDRWWKRRLPNPDNVGGEEDCACLMRDGGGMNDNNCTKELPFICKITAL